MPTLIRPAHCEEALPIGAVQVASWNTTYRGIVADDFLDNVSIEARAAIWRPALCEPDHQTFVHVAEVDGKIVGFAAAGPLRDAEAGFDCELYTLYLLQEYQRQGIGRALFNMASNRLVDQGYHAMIIHVLAVNNSARLFYEACGGQFIRQEPTDWGGKTNDLVSYGWRDLK